MSRPWLHPPGHHHKSPWWKKGGETGPGVKGQCKGMGRGGWNPQTGPEDIQTERLHLCSRFPISLQPSLVVPLSKQLDTLRPDKHVRRRNLGEIKALKEGATANPMSHDYHTLTHTRTIQNQVNEENHQRLVQKLEFKSWYAAWISCNTWPNFLGLTFLI